MGLNRNETGSMETKQIAEEAQVAADLRQPHATVRCGNMHHFIGPTIVSYFCNRLLTDWVTLPYSCGIGMQFESIGKRLHAAALYQTC